MARKTIDIKAVESESKSLKEMFSSVDNRALFAKQYGIPGGGPMIHQHINGLRPISMEAGIGYAIGFGKPLAEISPRLAAIIDRLPKSLKVASNQVNEPPAPAYGSLTSELLQIAEKMDDRGLILLIDKAEEIAVRHPRQKKEAA